jgi:hypothetical protein
MSEVLLRGWNVAVPVVDVGDDVFVIDDNDKRTFRLQVKSCRVDKGVATFTLSRPQLRATLPIELLYMFMLREESRWRFLLIPRVRLNDLHKEYLNARRISRALARVVLGTGLGSRESMTLEFFLGDRILEGHAAEFRQPRLRDTREQHDDLRGEVTVELLIVVESLVSDEHPWVQMDRVSESAAYSIAREGIKGERLPVAIYGAVDDLRCGR